MEPKCINCGQKLSRCHCEPEPLKCLGTSRVMDNSKALLVAFNRRPTDGDLRALDDKLKGVTP